MQFHGKFCLNLFYVQLNEDLKFDNLFGDYVLNLVIYSSPFTCFTFHTMYYSQHPWDAIQKMQWMGWGFAHPSPIKAQKAL
jgi:hypothetical protein